MWTVTFHLSAKLVFMGTYFGSSQENLSLRFSKDKDTDQPAHPCRLIRLIVFELNITFARIEREAV